MIQKQDMLDAISKEIDLRIAEEGLIDYDTGTWSMFLGEAYGDVSREGWSNVLLADKFPDESVLQRMIVSLAAIAAMWAMQIDRS
jgi:hypothetical protein